MHRNVLKFIRYSCIRGLGVQLETLLEFTPIDFDKCARCIGMCSSRLDNTIGTPWSGESLWNEFQLTLDMSDGHSTTRCHALLDALECAKVDSILVGEMGRSSRGLADASLWNFFESTWDMSGGPFSTQGSWTCAGCMGMGSSEFDQVHTICNNSQRLHELSTEVLRGVWQ